MTFNLLNKTTKIALVPVTLLGIFASANSASAVTLTGSIGISGGSNITENTSNTTIDFVNEIVNQATGDFSSLLGSSALSVSDLSLTKGANITFPFAGTYYSSSDITTFIDFGFVNLGSVGSGNLTFDLFEGNNSFVRSTIGNTSIYSNIGGITGVFKFDGDSFATGAIQSSISGNSSTFQITLETDEQPESVPEPATAGAFLFLGVLGATKASKRKKIG